MKSLRFLIAIAVIFAIAVIGVSAQGQRGGGRGQGQPGQPGQEGQAAQAPQDPMSTPTFSGLRFRSIGPGVTGGRVVGFAVDPNDRAKYFAAVASGGVWKTVNGGTTWTPVFDNYGSFSIGYIALDPKDSAVLWVGTGENNSQRSVAYGDGLYKSEDGGRTFRKVGLEKSEHIGKIVIDPRDSKTVYVAAQGPLWGPGGDRGLFKTTDGGKTWKNILNISEHTGVTDIAVDPSNPDIVYAASWQRRRHFYTLINGGPESALYKSTDGGATWNKLRGGLPSGEVGRIGIAVSPVSPNVVYATVEAEGQGSGIFRSQDRGATWERMNPAIAQAMYYSQIICDPKDVDRIYIPNVIFQVSDDGGRTIRPLGERSKHVDNHAIWIDPNNTNYYIVGSDGGIYDSYDRGATWQFKSKHADHAVLRYCSGQFDAVLQCLRRNSGQQQLVRAVEDAQRNRHHQCRLVCDSGWRRLPHTRRSRRSQHHIRYIAVRLDCPFRQAHGRAHRHTAERGQGRCRLPLELGLSADHQSAFAYAHLFCGQ
ncbi:MAG: hypothetical protein IPL01_03675 [Acidobacteria bacterium]|nr:hypothetical protein [Acidobacteriota bacterium]